MDLGICFASKIDDIDYIVRAEELGYTHAWIADSHMIWSDPYATLALVADRTSTIQVGTGVTVAATRTAPITASSMATINQLVAADTAALLAAEFGFTVEKQGFEVEEYIPEATWTVPEGGFYTWVKLPYGLDARAMLPRAVHALVAYVAGTAFYADGQGSQYMRLSYCYPTPERIREGVRRLGTVVSEEAELVKLFGVEGTHTEDAVDTPGPEIN